MIEITGLNHRTLSIDRLTIESGRTFLIGPNGSGKTTLLRLLAGIDLPESGTISINGSAPRTLEIGWVNEYPDRSLLFSRVYDEIASPLRFVNMNCHEVDSRVKDIASKIGILQLLDRPVRQLSGGEKILAAVAAALVSRPALLVLDEYDSHLDPLSYRRIDDAIRYAGSLYIIRCTQQMECAALGDRIILLQAGHVVHTGTPGEVFGHLERTPYYPRSWREMG